MCDFITYAASRAGSKHHGADEENQDAYDIARKGNEVILAVCDGAGSRSHSRTGANLIAKLTVGFLSNLDWTAPFGEQAKRFIVEAREAITVHAQGQNLSPRDLACTVLGLAVDCCGVRALQVGDGFIVLRDKDDDEYKLLFTGTKGEYANETVFVTHKDAEDFLQIYESGTPPAFACLSSDGVERQAIKMRDSTPHAPFFDYLVKVGKADCDKDVALSKFLAMPALNKVTDDDRTLVCMLRG